MIVWELINMSDAITFEANHDVAVWVAIVIGNGQYAAKPLSGDKDKDVPMFMFGGIDDFCQKNFGKDFEQLDNEMCDVRWAEAKAAFQSFIYGDLNDRKQFDNYSTFEERITAIRAWNEERRSSMNNIGERAFNFAEKIASKAPQQIFAS